MTQHQPITLNISQSGHDLIARLGGAHALLFEHARELEKKLVQKAQQVLAEELTTELQTRLHEVGPVLTSGVTVLPHVEEHRGSLYLHLRFDTNTPNYEGPKTLAGTNRPHTLYKAGSGTPSQEANRFIEAIESIREDVIARWEAHVAPFVHAVSVMQEAFEKTMPNPMVETFNGSPIRHSFIFDDASVEVAYSYDPRLSRPFGAYVRISEDHIWTEVIQTDTEAVGSDKFQEMAEVGFRETVNMLIHSRILLQFTGGSGKKSSRNLSFHLSEKGEGLIVHYPTSELPVGYLDLYLNGDGNAIRDIYRLLPVFEAYDAAQPRRNERLLSMTWVDGSDLADGKMFDLDKNLVSKGITAEAFGQMLTELEQTV